MLLYYRGLFFTTISCLIFNAAQSQSLGRQVVSAAGKTVQADNLMITYVLGEPISGTFAGDSQFTTAGFLQPEISGETLRSGFKIVQQIVVYPNPVTTGYVRLDFKNISSGDYTIDIIDAIGRLMLTQKVSYSAGNSNISIDVTSFIGGTYFVRLRGKDFVQGQGKLIKL